MKNEGSIDDKQAKKSIRYFARKLVFLHTCEVPVISTISHVFNMPPPGHCPMKRQNKDSIRSPHDTSLLLQFKYCDNRPISILGSEQRGVTESVKTMQWFGTKFYNILSQNEIIFNFTSRHYFMASYCGWSSYKMQLHQLEILCPLVYTDWPVPEHLTAVDWSKRTPALACSNLNQSSHATFLR
jgi:hypothetical protein